MGEWTEVRLGDVCKVINGRAYSQNELLNSGKYPVLRVGNFFSRNKWYYSDLTLDENKYCECGDLLYAWSASFGPKIWDGQKVIYHYHIWKLDVSPHIDKYYLFYWLLTSSKSLTSGIHGSVMGHLTKSNMENQIILLPNIVIQKKIASVLSSLDDKIKINTRMNKVLEEIAQALFHRWFVEFEFPNADGKPYKSAGGKMVESEMGSVPEGWKVQPVSKLLTINPKLSLKKGHSTTYINMAALSINTCSIFDVVLKEFGGGGSKFQNGDVLLARITPCLENGKTAIVDFLSEGEIGFGSTEFIVLRGEGVIGTSFVYCLARNPNFRSHCITSMVGSSGRQRVQNACFNDFLMARPPDEIFVKFNKVCGSMFDLITINSQSIKELGEARDILLPRLMDGELKIEV